MVTTTTNVGLKKPEEVTDDDQWGDQLNDNADTLESWISPWSAQIGIGTVNDGDYTIILDMPFNFSITSVITQTDSGSATVTVKIGTTALGGSANTADSSKETQAHSSNNTGSAGDKVIATISSNSNAQNLVIQVKGTRTSAS